MTASAYAQVVYGFSFDTRYLQTQDGFKRACRRNKLHEVLEKPHCPECGDFVEDAYNMVASEVVRRYATAHCVSTDKVLEDLSDYEFASFISRNGKDHEVWIFGKSIAESGSWSGLAEFKPVQDPELNALFTELGLNPAEAKYFIITMLS